MIRFALISKILLIILLNLNVSHGSDDFLDRFDLHKKNSRDYGLPKKTRNPQYQMLSNAAHAWHDFHKEEYKKYLANSDNWGESSHIYKKNIKSSAYIKDEIFKVDHNLSTSEQLLETLLKGRLEYIYHKKMLYQDCLKGNEDLYWIATHPSSISKRIQILQTDYPKKPELIETFKKDVRRVVDNYQYQNLMIYYAYKLHDPAKLPLKIKRLIACSRTLWPILQDETTDLSHPDAAYLGFKNDEIREKDGDFYEANYKSMVEKEITLMNWGKQKTIIIESPLHNQDLSVLPLFKPSWLYPKENSKEIFEPKKDQVSLEIPLKQKTFASFKPKKQQMNKRPQVISHKTKPQQFKEVKNTSIQEYIPIIDEVMAQDLEDSLLEISPEVLPIKEEPTTIKIEELPDICSVDLEKAVSPSSLKSEIFESKNNIENIPTLKKQKQVKLQKVSQAQENTIANLDIQTTSRQEFTRPKGMRSFHPKSASSNFGSESCLALNNKSSKLIDVIFDIRKKGQGFTFGQFKNLWEKINGHNTVRSDSGGSHYRLLNTDGKVVGGTFAHGEGQTYCAKTVRYLRDALYTVGVAPEDIY
ncbi:MAG: hypothetical protein ACRYGR_09720 [Janthinobacterium lividum]